MNDGDSAPVQAQHCYICYALTASFLPSKVPCCRRCHTLLQKMPLIQCQMATTGEPKGEDPQLTTDLGY